MALVLADRVRETTTTTGTGAVTLGGAYTGFQTFSAAIGNANTTYYTIANVTTNEWEVGIGTYTSGTNSLSRDTVLASSNSGSLVSFVSGSKDVFVTQPAERAVYVGSNGTTVSLNILTASGDSSFTSTGALQIPVGTTGQQPTGANGKIRYNTTLSQYEGYNSSTSTWALLGGAFFFAHLANEKAPEERAHADEKADDGEARQAGIGREQDFECGHMPDLPD